MKKSKDIWFVVAVIAAVVLFSLLFIGKNKTNGNEIVIGGAISLTGDNSMQGNRGLNGILLAIDFFNEEGGIQGKKINFIPEDTQTSPKGTVSAYNKLAQVDKAKAIITTGDIEFQAVNEISKKAKVVTIATTCSGMLENNRSPYLFRYCFNEKIEDVIMMDFIKNVLQDSIITLFYPNNMYGQEILKYSLQEAKPNKITINPISFDPNSMDQRSVAIKIMKTNPRIISARGFGASFESVLRNLSEIGFKGQIIGDGTLTIPTSISNTKGMTEGAYAVAGDLIDNGNPLISKYKQRYLEKYNEEASVWDALGFDTCMFLLYAIRYSLSENVSLDKAMYNVQNVPLLLGNNKFGNSNDAEFEMNIFRILNGQPVLQK